MFESKSGILLIAGIGFFALAFLSNGLVPALMYAHQKEKTVEEMIQEQVDARGWNIMSQFQLMKQMYPEAFKKHGIEVTQEACANLLREARQSYIGEGCWHCHSQFIRPVSNEDRRWGPVSKSSEYQNELQRPVLFGTRRVGPDLTREGGKRGNDWHAAHFYKPKLTSPGSVMPDYPWFFDGDPGSPNRRGIAMILYMQFQSSWLDSYGLYNLIENRNPYTGP